MDCAGAARCQFVAKSFAADLFIDVNPRNRIIQSRYQIALNVGKDVFPRRCIYLKYLPLIIEADRANIWFLLTYGLRPQDLPFYIILLLFMGYMAIWRLRRIPEQAPWLPGEYVANSIHKILGPVPFFVLFLIVVGAWIAELTGRAKAETQKDYLVFGDRLDVAVIRIYDDRILAVRVDRKTKEIQPEVIIRKIEKDNVQLIRDTNVGPLKKSKWSDVVDPGHSLSRSWKRMAALPVIILRNLSHIGAFEDGFHDVFHFVRQ